MSESVWCLEGKDRPGRIEANSVSAGQRNLFYVVIILILVLTVKLLVKGSSTVINS
jgi:hypothetical protein